MWYPSPDETWDLRLETEIWEKPKKKKRFETTSVQGALCRVPSCVLLALMIGSWFRSLCVLVFDHGHYGHHVSTTKAFGVLGRSPWSIRFTFSLDFDSLRENWKAMNLKITVWPTLQSSALRLGLWLSHGEQYTWLIKLQNWLICNQILLLLKIFT